MLNPTEKLDEDVIAWETCSISPAAKELEKGDCPFAEEGQSPFSKEAPARSTDARSARTRSDSIHGEQSAPMPDQGAPRSDAPVAVAGHVVLEELGRGGMGIVYKARQVKLNRLVALKMVLADSRIGPQDLARFRTEGEAVACLQHPNIVQIHEVGEDAGRPYFALEFVDGGSLAEKLKAGPLAPVQAAELL